MRGNKVGRVRCKMGGIGVPQMEVYLVLIGIITIDEVHTKWKIRYQRQVVTCLMGSISSLDFGMIL